MSTKDNFAHVAVSAVNIQTDSVTNIVLLTKEYDLIDFRFLTFVQQLVESVQENN